MSRIEEIRQAYHWILGREADQGGLDTYGPDYEAGTLDWRGLRRIFLDSAEFAASVEDYRIVEMPGGMKVVVDANEPEFGRAIVGHRIWEPHVVSAIQAHLKEGDVYVDIGANVGVMAFNAAAAVGPSGKVIGFEPNPSNVGAFQRGVLANGLANVRLYPFAVSDAPRLISITRASNAKGKPTLDPLQFNHVVQAVPADEMLDREARVDFIKMDIEGFELPALHGLARTFARHHPMVLCEFNPLCLRDGGFTPESLAEHIFTLTPRVDVIDHGDERWPVGSVAELMDMWRRRDREATEAGHLPEGWVHFDLLFRAGG